MLELLKYMEKALGNYRAVAAHIGYSERQYYNIRKRLKSGETLSHRVENYVLHKYAQLKYEEMQKESSE